MTILVRALAALWGFGFSAMALQGIFDPAAFTEAFGVTAEGHSINNLRADYGGFFLVSGLGALWGALRPSDAKALWVPAALFGAAFLIRIVGLADGDPGDPSITQAMIVEAVSVLFLLGSARYLGRSEA